MVLSLGAVFVTVAIVLVVSWRPKHETMQSADFESAKSYALTATNWPILYPEVFPSGFSVTSARFEAESYGEPGDSRWYIGLTSTDQEFMSIWQSDGVLKDVQAAATNNGDCTSEITLNDRIWQKCESTKPDTRALVRTDGDLIYVISGNASWDELINFTGSLIESAR